MNAKLIGGILLIVGTSIGGGMLALPLATAQSGFLGALLLLIGSWMVMTFGAFLILEVNLWLPEKSNIISMADATLGKMGKYTAWIVYLLLLYSLIAAYVAAGSDVTHTLFSLVHLQLPHTLCAFIFLLILGWVVFSGIESIDIVNRVLMTIKLISLLILLLLGFRKIQFHQLIGFHSSFLISAVTIVITSFGFATIIPSLRTYFNSDINKLRQTILIGSLIPFVAYIFWVAVVLGELPLNGEYGLLTILTSQHQTALLTQALVYALNNPWINSIARLFTSICVATSFLGVSLCLADFLADGLHFKKEGAQNFYLHLIVFLPPLCVVWFYPQAFIIALHYAGIFCAILLVLLPAIMAWQGRYFQNIQAHYQVMGGKLFLILAILAGISIIVQEFLIDFNIL